MTDSVKQPATLIRSQYRNATHYLPDFPEVEVCHFLLLQGPTHCSTAVSCSLPSTDRSIPGCVLQEADTACIMSMKSALRVATHRNERKEGRKEAWEEGRCCTVMQPSRRFQLIPGGLCNWSGPSHMFQTGEKGSGI